MHRPPDAPTVDDHPDEVQTIEYGRHGERERILIGRPPWSAASRSSRCPATSPWSDAGCTARRSRRSLPISIRSRRFWRWRRPWTLPPACPTSTNPRQGLRMWCTSMPRASYAEGQRGLSERVRAWCLERQQPIPPRFHALAGAVNVRDEDAVARFLARITARAPRPALVVIDTLSQCFAAGKENTSEDMGGSLCGRESDPVVHGRVRAHPAPRLEGISHRWARPFVFLRRHSYHDHYGAAGQPRRRPLHKIEGPRSLLRPHAGAQDHPSGHRGRGR
jgi:AAA domain